MDVTRKLYTLYSISINNIKTIINYKQLHVIEKLYIANYSQCSDVWKRLSYLNTHTTHIKHIENYIYLNKLKEYVLNELETMIFSLLTYQNFP